MGSAKKALGKIMGVSSKKAALITMMNQPTDAQRVANGEGRMLNGKYQAFSAEDKAHYDAAQANRNAEYQDISESCCINCPAVACVISSTSSVCRFGCFS